MSDDYSEEGSAAVGVKKEKKRRAGVPKEEGVAIQPVKEGEEREAGGEVEEEEEVEALSHKEMRMRRKAEKQAARAGGSTITPSAAPPVHPSRAAAVAVANNKASLDATTKRSRYSIWVGNLLFSTSVNRLQEWFEDKGILGISRVNMPPGQKKTDHNRGFAYVDVPSADALQQCIDLSESNLDGRRLLIKSGTDYTGRPEIDRKAVELAGGIVALDAATGEVPLQKGKTGLTKTAQKILRAQKHPPGPTLFIGNLSFNTTEDSLREMIERSAAARDEWSNGKAKRKSDKKRVKKESKSKDSSDEAGSSSDSSDSEGLSSDGSEHEDERKDGDKKEKKGKKGEGLRGAGIRKIRMGQFEDTGKCKGFAFIDFFTAAYATASLIDPRNGKLDGRDLLLQFASADAVRRGAPKGQIAPGPRPFRDNKRPAPAFKRRHEDAFVDREEQKPDFGPAPAPGTFDADAPLVKKHKETQEERQRRREAQGTGNRRVKPGAALANAKRGKTSIAIDAPQGVKKTFD